MCHLPAYTLKLHDPDDAFLSLYPDLVCTESEAKHFPRQFVSKHRFEFLDSILSKKNQNYNYLDEVSGLLACY